jgi:hypothetical protein
MSRKRVIDIRQPELTDEQWELLEAVLPEPEASPGGGPKPVPNRPVSWMFGPITICPGRMAILTYRA